MSFRSAFDEAIQNELLHVGEVLEFGALPDDLQLSVISGELTLEQAGAIMLQRCDEPAPVEQGAPR